MPCLRFVLAGLLCLSCGAAAAQAIDTDKLRRLDPESEVWIDTKHHQVVVGGEVVLREGPLELFACLKGTKEHEAVVAVRSKAYVVHAALLAVGAEAGKPAIFVPEYRPASGTTIEVELEWTGADGKPQRVRAQDMVRLAKTKEPMTQEWVFGGSGFYEDEVEKVRYYQAESGDLICVSNFPSAMLDLPIESSQSNEALMFEANTDKIPPVGTQVKVVLTPRLEEQAQGK